jgi:hypothetical protein
LLTDFSFDALKDFVKKIEKSDLRLRDNVKVTRGEELGYFFIGIRKT